MILINTILFILAVIICFYIPGTVVLTFLKIKRDWILDIILSLCFGLCLFLLASYITVWVHLNFLIWGYLGAFLVTYVFQIKSQHVTKSQTDWIPILLITFGSVLYTVLTFFSGWKTSQGLQFIGVNEADGLVHIARIKDFFINFPPLHPGLSGIEFRGYHYFYDFLLSQFHSLFGLNIFDLYFRDFSFFISMLFGLSFLLFAKENKFSRLQTNLIILLAFFTPGVAAVSERILGMEVILSILVASNYIFDPSMVLSISLLVVGLALLPKTVKSFQYAMIVGVILGVISQVKVYAGLIAIIAICFYGLYLVVRTRKINQVSYICMGLFVAVLTAATFLPNNFGAGSFVFSPFLFYEHFIKQEAFEKSQWELKRQIFLLHNNIPRIIILYTQAVVLFFVYAIGIKLIVLVQMFSIRKKKFWLNDSHVILLVSILAGLFIPTFFIQSVSVFDIGQFFAVSIILLSIPAAGTVWWLYSKNKFIGVFVIGIVLFFSFIEMYTVLTRYLFEKNPYIVSNSQLEIYSSISKQVSPQEFLVSIPNFEGADTSRNIKWYKPSLVSAMTGRSVYVEDEIIKNPKNMRTIINRENDIKQLSSFIDSCSQEEIIRKMEKIGTKNIVSQTPESCLNKLSTNFKESEAVSFYRLK